MICAAPALAFVLLMYDPRDGHLRGIHDFCSRPSCEEAKAQIVRNAQPKYRSFLQTHDRCLRK